MLKRAFPVCLLAGLLLTGLFVAPAVGGGGKSPSMDRPPEVEAEVSWTEGTASLRAWGEPGMPGTLRVDVAQFLAGPLNPTFEHFDLPFTFDANGYFEIITPLATLATWGEFDLVVEVATVGLSGEPVLSNPWGMRMRLLDPAASGTPATPGGGGAAYAVPGTTAPLFPYTWAAIAHNSEVAFFQVAFTGIEGVIPVN